MSYQNIQHLLDNFYQTQRICSWIMAPNMQLLSTNCPHQEYFHNLFSVSGCPEAILHHFNSSSTPIITSDKVGFVWISSLQPSDEEHPTPVTYILGPVFTSEITQQYLQKHLVTIHSSADTVASLWQFLSEIPSITPETASCFASMLHFSATAHPVLSSDVTIWTEPDEKKDIPEWGDTKWHGTWLAEQRLFQSIKEGRIEDTRKFSTGRIGQIGAGDPLRQAKNEALIFSVICSRGSILGGVSSESAYILSDYFIDKIERARTIAEVRNVSSEMYYMFIRKVSEAKTNRTYSIVVRACLDYVDAHVMEKISLKNMADEIGYHENYISRCVKKETGKNLFDIVNQKKVDVAKSILSDRKLSLHELSSLLDYSSPSYFCSVFKKETGMSPMQYAEGCPHKES